MRRIGGFCFVVVSLVATPAVVNAQRCLGTASFADGHLRAQVGRSSVQGWRSTRVGLSLGHERGAFVSGGASRGTYDNSDVTVNGLSASVGYQVPVGTRVQVCPTLSVGRSTFTYYTSRSHVDYWGTATGISTSVGVTAWSSSRFDFVPSAELAYSRSSERMQSATRGMENEAQGTYGSGGLSITAGLIFGKVISVSPFVALPVGVRGANNVSGISVAISFGNRK
ncbi:MAG: hypothetical protein WC700_09960 [Gemmatimonadaceae bacterium]|jgi:hypothetical protein